MNSDNSLGIFLSKQDHVVALAGYRNIASRALGMAIFAAQNVVRAEQQALTDALAEGDGSSTLDARNALDLTTGDHNGYADDDDDSRVDSARAGREPPAGLEAMPTPEERLHTAVALYACAEHRCRSLATNQYDLPQDLASRMDWTKTRAMEAMRTRPVQLRTTAEKLAFAAKVTQAKRDFEFWRDHGDDVYAAVETALSNVRIEDDGIDALDLLDGVDAHQYAIQAGIGVQNTRVRLEIALQRFPAHTMVGRSMISDLGALELSLSKFKELVDRLESEHAGEIQSAVMAGRNLLSTESIDAAYGTAVDRAVGKALDTQADFRIEELADNIVRQ
jgi:hypothetical protein